jgi:hypothetical protein
VVKKSSQAIQDKWHPLRRDHLDMGELRYSIRSKRVNQAGGEARPSAAGDLAHEEEHSEPGQHEGGEKQQVIRKDDVAGQRVNRKDLHCLREQMFRVGERQRLWIKNVRVPEISNRAEVAAEKPQNAVGIPRQNPRVQQRVTQIPWDVSGEAGGERPRKNERDGEIQSRRLQRAEARLRALRYGGSAVAGRRRS